ncbi:MAG: hypothetical protein NWR03_06225 [Akkermansiaceae bacterium]|nr:hypothetical protein [Akkermansiaceae bacterium]MDP4780987.1 hypothetical protein [Akkermansiaceae bacterium]MDP4897353.1 hypothetical protein [Akkermansiaceae bacterium]
MINDISCQTEENTIDQANSEPDYSPYIDADGQWGWWGSLRLPRKGLRQSRVRLFEITLSAQLDLFILGGVWIRGLPFLRIIT